MSTTTNSSVDQVFDVLAALSASEEATGVAQLARALDVPTSTAHRVLATLEEAGYVARDTTGTKYQLGLGAQELTHALLRRFPIQAASPAFLRRLSGDTGETVVLCCRIGFYAVRAASMEGWREVHAAPRLGQTSRLEDTAGGRAILAALDDALLERYVRWRGGGKRVATAIAEDVAAVRAAGYALDRHDDGRSDIALPLRDGDGRVVASIAIEAAAPEGGARGERTRIARARAVAGELETLLHERPELAADPFAHLPPEQLDPGFDVAGAR